MNTSASRLHPRNPHQGRYDLKALVALCPELKSHLTVNPKGEQTVDFRNEQAVRLLNQALLMQHYQVAHWNIPEGYLCPPIPGRADYIHYAADLLDDSKERGQQKGDKKKGDKKKNAKVLDIGTGANCIYPIIGNRSYGWQFVGSDIDPVSVATAKLIVESNSVLKNKIKLVHQKNKKTIFEGVIGPHDVFDLTLCNPPFHASLAEANAGSERKQHNLNRNKAKRNTHSVNTEASNKMRNFGGQKAELWCEGGEITFLKQMINESKNYSQQVMWFTSLVSKNENLKPLQKLLNQIGAKQIKVVNMSQGQKISRLIAWSFLANEQIDDWNKQRLQS